MKEKSFIKLIIITILSMMVLITTLVVVVDPYFHFHKPISFLSYPLVNERYQNDGLSRNFDYDAIITGTSMTENCRASLVDELFKVKSIPLCNSGGSFKEINNQLVKALQRNGQVKMVIRGLDLVMLTWDKDYIGKDLPEYLYDENIFNDVGYIFNKEAIVNSLEALYFTIRGYEPTSLDDYTNWMEDAEYGKEHMYSLYGPSDVILPTQKINNEELERERENLEENVIKVAIDNPDIDFYYFISPYSIFHFDGAYRSGYLNNILAQEKEAIEMLIEYDNIHLFSYLNNGDIITNLDNYRDILHYCEWINAEILNDMKNDNNRITKDNYKEYFEERDAFFKNYDFDALFN